MDVSGQLHASATLPPGTHWIRGWVGPRAILDSVEKKIFFGPAGDWTLVVVQQVARRNTDWASRFIIIMIGKTAHFNPYTLVRSCQICLELDHPVFTSLDFATVIFFTEFTLFFDLQSAHLCEAYWLILSSFQKGKLLYRATFIVHHW
jgi:hypothetical protein